MSYDANGNLLGDGQRTYIWNARDQLVEIRQGGSVAASFQYDAQGSTRALTDANGNVVQRYDYSPYGETQASSAGFSNPYQYTGRERDQSGLYYYRARYYDEGMKRFIAEDPIGLQGGINWYAYVGGNPVSAIDPYGLRTVFVAVWHQRGGSVGHVYVGEINGQVLLSQFPNPHSVYGENMTYSWQATLAAEKRNPDSMYKVFIKDDAVFDAVVENHRNRAKWAAHPLTNNQTQCAYAAYNALQAGGINISAPVTSPVIPNGFDADLLGSMLSAGHGVTPVGNIPWR